MPYFYYILKCRDEMICPVSFISTTLLFHISPASSPTKTAAIFISIAPSYSQVQMWWQSRPLEYFCLHLYQQRYWFTVFLWLRLFSFIENTYIKIGGENKLFWNTIFGVNIKDNFYNIRICNRSFNCFTCQYSFFIGLMIKRDIHYIITIKTEITHSIV